MTLQEFAKLRVGHKVKNFVGSREIEGEVTGATENGVSVVWGPRHPLETPFFFSVQTTAWMHWSAAEAETPPPPKE